MLNANHLDRFLDSGLVQYFRTRLFPTGLPIFFAIILGTFLAVFIEAQDWALAFAVIFIIPAFIIFLRYPFSAILVWMSIMPFLQTTIDPRFRTGFWLIHRFLPIIALIGYILFSKIFVTRKNRSIPRPGPAEYSVAIFLVITILNVYIFQSDPVIFYILVYDRIIIPICLYVLVRLIEPRGKDVERLLPLILVILLIESFVAILSQTAVQLIPSEWAFHQGERAVGTFDNAHAFTMSMVFFILLLYHGAMQSESRFWRTVYLIGTAAGVVGILLSFTRGSWLGGIVAGIGVLILYPKKTLRFGMVLFAAILILGLAFFTSQIDFVMERLGSEDTALDRLVIWDAGRQMIELKPIVGWGYENYSEVAPQFQQRVQNYVAANPHASHNALITIAAEMGIPALLLFLFPVVWWLMLSPTVWSKIPKSGFWSQKLLVVLWLVILDVFVETTFTDIHHSTYNQGLWWITLGLIANMIYAYQYPDDLKIFVRKSS